MDRIAKSFELMEVESDSFITETVSYIASLNLYRKRWTILTFREVISGNGRVTEDADLLLFINLDPESVKKLRERFFLHPIIDSECSNFSPRDQILELGDHLLITFSVFDFAQLELFGIHIIFFYNKLLVFSNRPVYSLARISKDEGFKNSPFFADLDECSEENFMSVEIECFSSEKILIKMMAISMYRLHSYIRYLESETLFYLKYSTETTVFYTFWNLKKMFGYRQVLNRIKNALRPKKLLANKMLECGYIRDEMKFYLLSLKHKAIALKRKNKEVLSLVKATEHIYEIAQDEKKRIQSEHLDNFFEIFEAFITVWIPLLYLIAMNSINVIIPYQFDDSLSPFYYSTAYVFAASVFLIIFLKFKNLI